MYNLIGGLDLKKKHRYTYLLSAGHMCSDINQGALPAILPFFISAYNFNYTAAAGLILTANIVSSIVQPLFGQMADKKSRPWIMAVGILFAGGGMAVTGFISNFIGLCIAVMISGIGIAAFHPEAAQLVNRVSDVRKKGAGIGTFSFGGSVGFAVGPIISTIAITLFGLKGTLVLAIPALIMCIALFSQSRNLEQASQKQEKANKLVMEPVEKDQWGPFSLLTIVVFGRSIVFYGLNTFLALYWINILKQSEQVGNASLSILFAIGAISTLLGGKLADRFGFRKIIKIGFILLPPSILLLTLTENSVIATLLLLPIGYALNVPNSPTVVLGQKYLPNRLGLASGITLGLAISVGGILAPVLGILADTYGLIYAMYAIILISLIPAIFSFALPKPEEASNKI